MTMTLPRIIAICGVKRSGKDTVSDYLVQKYGYQKMKFAEPLKNMVKTLFSMTDDQVESDEKDAIDDRWKVTPRSILQFFGTEVMQYKIQDLLPGVGRTFWAESLFKSYNGETHIVISDLRFQHEVDVIKTYCSDYIVIRVLRRCDPSCDPSCTHISETEQNIIVPTHTIENYSNLQALHSTVDTIMRDVRCGQNGSKTK